MKTYDNKIYQKLNTIADWILRIVLINFMMIIFSLPIVTMYPALMAGYKMFTRYLKKEEVPIFKGYFQTFTENFGHKMQMGILLAMVVALAAFNLTIYSDYTELNNDLFSMLGYYVMIILIVTALFITFYTFPLMSVYPKTDTWLLIKFAFYLSGKFIFRTILAVLILGVPFLMLFNPITMLIFLFIGVSTPIILYALLFKDVMTFVEGLGQENV